MAVGCAGRAMPSEPSEVTNGGAPTDADPDPLAPYSLDSLACTGTDYPDDGSAGYLGQCCTKAACYTPDDGECAPREDATSALGLFFGSGKCLCGEVRGPFAPNPGDTPTSSGTCCYLLPSIGCTGDWLVSELRGALAA